MHEKMRKTLVLLALALSSVGLSYADTAYLPEVVTTQQQTTCNGKVVDNQGEPIIGASVMIIGQKKGAVSDLDGRFSLSDVKMGATLSVSYVGYKTQNVVWNGKDLTITLMEDSETLNDVVVVGYGSQKKINLTGAVSVVSTKTLEGRSVQNLAQALQGSVPGLNFSVNNAGGSLDGRMRSEERRVGKECRSRWSQYH